MCEYLCMGICVCVCIYVYHGVQGFSHCVPKSSFSDTILLSYLEVSGDPKPLANCIQSMRTYLASFLTNLHLAKRLKSNSSPSQNVLPLWLHLASMAGCLNFCSNWFIHFKSSWSEPIPITLMQWVWMNKWMKWHKHEGKKCRKAHKSHTPKKKSWRGRHLE